jgi:hypothetical protein
VKKKINIIQLSNQGLRDKTFEILFQGINWQTDLQGISSLYLALASDFAAADIVRSSYYTGGPSLQFFEL